MATITLSESNDQQHIDVNAGDTIQIELEESPTTGYRWEITELNREDIEVTSEDFKLNAESGMGGGGKKTILLKVLKKAAGRIKLENRQPWSGDVAKSLEVSYS